MNINMWDIQKGEPVYIRDVRYLYTGSMVIVIETKDGKKQELKPKDFQIISAMDFSFDGKL